ncbi:Uncharacterised protein [Mycobacterium tuberculosis]|nr:Uncharacterised protein [Mycobacterium tuberculosis]
MASPKTMYAGTPCSLAVAARQARSASNTSRSPASRASAALAFRARDGDDGRPIVSLRSGTAVSPRSTPAAASPGASVP